MSMAGRGGMRCLKENFGREKFNDDDIQTVTSDEQNKVEEAVEQLYSFFRAKVDIDPECPTLNREEHVQFLKKGLGYLPSTYEALDASRPWVCYWLLHSLEILDVKLNESQGSNIARFLEKCQHPDGGFGGGPGQVGHLAPTYAAINTLCIIGTEEAYNVINRKTLLEYLYRMKTPEDAFKMHDGGEIDIRGAYCAASAATLTNVCTPDLFDGTAEWIVSCQTYEGGFSGTNGMEAHGGYTFCGFATLVMLGKERLCDIKLLLKWAVNRQMRFEGGFQGRTNKLVDGCYSFWQGGLFPLIHRMITQDEPLTLGMEKWLFNQGALQEYLLICCQTSGGGLIDKPGKNRDYYHTCYTLSGLSVAQHFAGGKLAGSWVLGDSNNEVAPTHPIYNMCLESVVNAHQYFSKLRIPARGLSDEVNGT